LLATFELTAALIGSDELGWKQLSYFNI